MKRIVQCCLWRLVRREILEVVRREILEDAVGKIDHERESIELRGKF